MIALLKSKWNALSASDRRIYAMLIALVSALIIYALIWLPSQQARVRLDKIIQEKNAQLVQMQVQAAQINALKSAFKLSHSNAAGLQTALETSAKLHGMSGKISKLEQDSSGAINIALASVTFDEWLSWVSALQAEHQVRIASCHIASLGGNTGLVKVDASFTAE